MFKKLTKIRGGGGFINILGFPKTFLVNPPLGSPSQEGWRTAATRAAALGGGTIDAELPPAPATLSVRK